MTKYTFLFVALLLILFPFFGLKANKQLNKPAKIDTSTVPKSADTTTP